MTFIETASSNPFACAHRVRVRNERWRRKMAKCEKKEDMSVVVYLFLVQIWVVIAPNGRERRGVGVSDEGKAAKCMLLLSSLVLSFAPYTYVV